MNALSHRAFFTVNTLHCKSQVRSFSHFDVSDLSVSSLLVLLFRFFFFPLAFKISEVIIFGLTLS